MKKILPLVLALVMFLSLSVTAFANETTGYPDGTMYVDISKVLDSTKTLSSVTGEETAEGGSYSKTITHVSGTVYSCNAPAGFSGLAVTLSYTDGTSFEFDVDSMRDDYNASYDLYTPTSSGSGTWSTYDPAAASTGPSVTNGNKNVTGKYVADAESGAIYKVDIQWGAMAFTYTSAGRGTWQTDSHTYKDATTAKWTWESGANEIKVTNHSNDGITVPPSYTPDSGYESANMDIAPAALSLATADNGVDGAAGTATDDKITVTPSGSIPQGTSGKIGQITLSLSGQPVEVSDEESLVAALSAGRTAKLAGDFSVSNAITVSASSVLNLNGHVLSTSAPLNVATGGSLTVMDSASGGKLTSTATAIQNQGGTLVVNSGTIESSYNAVALYGGTTQLNGGTFHSAGSGSYVVLVANNVSDLSIIGGNYTGGQYSVYNPYYSFTITGGTFEKLFKTPNWTVTITVTGGTYGFDPTDYIDATVSYIKDNEDGTYTVLLRDENTTLPIMQNVDSLAKLTSVTKTGGTATLSSSLTGEGLKVTETQTLADGVNLTLDVNGKALQATGLAPIFSVPSTATLTITNSSTTQGYVNINGNAGAVITVDGTLYVKGGQVSCSAQYSIEVSESGNAEITGGIAYTVGTSGTVTLSGGSSNAVYVNGGKTTVSGGTVNAVVQVNGGTLDVTSGSVSVINATAGTVTVSGGTITSTIVAGGTSSITITGGTITGSLNQNGTGTLTITGGTFSNDPTEYVPEGYTVTTNESGTYTVTTNS